MSEEITRGREPIQVKLSTSLTIFLVTAVAAIVGAATWLNKIAEGQEANREALRVLQTEVTSQLRREVDLNKERLNRLEWELKILQDSPNR